MNNKPYKLGILVGRFQTLHFGHEYMINKAIELCDEVGIFIGSSQESGTNKNPFSFEKRYEMLKILFDDKISVWPLPDIGVGNTACWGDYVLKNVVERYGKEPDLLISGKESRRTGWVDDTDHREISELYVPKIIEISATEMREFFINDDFESWKKYTNSKLWSQYNELRKTVLLAKDNLETKSI